MPAVVPPSSTFDWSKLAFGLYETNGHIQYTYKDGAWGKAEWVKEPYLRLHIGSVALNYGSSCFEGLKAFRHEDGQVRLFRPQENAARMSYSGEAVSIPAVPEELFLEAVEMAVGRNLELVPPHAPYGASGSMYVRPLLFASGAQLGLMAPDEFTFIVYVTPTGSLYGSAGGKAPAVDAVVVESFDRAAPKGTGSYKLAGNYAPILKFQKEGKEKGYAITLHLDSKTRTHVDEFSTSNFVAIKRPSSPDAKPTFVVPRSESILKSVTTKSLVDIALSLGWEVELRPVPFKEVIEGGFAEVMACGTAAAITPIRSITYNDSPDLTKRIVIGDGENAGPRTLELLQALTGVQSGTKPDTFGFLWPKDGVDGSK
ncbi:hypothetical protein JCM11641_004271 [Rhodosporidiobolus odoratus]